MTMNERIKAVADAYKNPAQCDGSDGEAGIEGGRGEVRVDSRISVCRVIFGTIKKL